MRNALALTFVSIALAGCGKLTPADGSDAANGATPEPPTEESLLQAFVADQIPKTGVSGPRSWTWQGAARMAEGLTSPFTTTVTVIDLGVKKADDDAYEGIVSWDCAGTGPYRCFENRFSHEETKYRFAPDGRQWQKVETRHRAK